MRFEKSRLLLAVALLVSCVVVSPGVALAQTPMTNGQNHLGTIATVGQIDTWTFTAAPGDAIALNIGEVGGNTTFSPWIRLLAPDGSQLGSQSGALVAQINATATLTGTYQVLVTSAFATTGSYALTLVKIPGGFIVPPGDEGGPMTAGFNHPGNIALGDLDPWTFVASKSDAIVLNIGEPIAGEVDPGFNPWIRLFGPDGALLGSQSGARVAQITVTAPLTGTYTVLVTSAFANADAGKYLLTLVKAPGTFTVPDGDEGGAMTAGFNHPGVIAIGDLDPWTFTANKNDSIALNIGEFIVGEVDPGFNPWIRLYRPDGALMESQSGARVAQINVTAPLTGTYTVVVTSAFVNTDDGHYRLTLVKVPGTFVVPPGDEGGLMTAGANHPGVIALGDLDPWTFTASKNDAIALNIGEPIIGEVDPGFNPWIRLFGPDGTLLGSQSGARVAQINVTAPLSGTYTVVVTSAFVNTEDGHYLLTLIKAPGAFVVPPGDQGGPMTTAAQHPGVIALGDLDPWSFTADKGNPIVLKIGETMIPEVDPGFNPWIRLFGPDGTLLGSQSGALTAQINVTAPLTGAYTVVVTSAFANVDAGHYLLTVTGIPAQSQRGAELTSPPLGSTLPGSTVRFEWSGGVGATQYWLWIGSTPGGTDLLAQYEGINLSATVAGLPADGRPLYVRLFSVVNGTWLAADYTFTATRSAPARAEVLIPPPSSTLTATTVEVRWTGGTGATRYWLWVGNTAGGSDLFTQDQGTNLSTTVAGLPADGRTLYARLWSVIGGAWLFNDYTFTAASGAPARGEVTMPPPESTLTSTTVRVQWTGGRGVGRYWLYVGSTPGGADLASQDLGTGLGATVAGLPADRRALYVRLWSVIGGAWLFTDYHYTAAGAVPAAAELVRPAPVSTLSATTARFEWTGGVGVTRTWLQVGTAPGGADLFNQDQGTGLSATVSGLPADGRALYARLFSVIGDQWFYSDYTYTAVSSTAAPAQLVSPAPQSTLTATTVNFEWTGGTGVTRYWLQVGSAPGGADFFSQDQNTNLSATVAGLPADGRPLYVRLFSVINGAWSYTDYSYSASATTPARADLVGPAARSLTATNNVFQWTGGTGVTRYWLVVGSTAGGSDLLIRDQGTNLSTTVGGLPADIRVLYVRLWSVVGDGWQFADYSYATVP